MEAMKQMKRKNIGILAVILLLTVIIGMGSITTVSATSITVASPNSGEIGSNYKVQITGSDSFSNIDTSNSNFNVIAGRSVENAKFYSNKKTYTQIPVEIIQLTLQSIGTAPIWIKTNEPWKIINVVTGKTVNLPICIPIGYGGCGIKKLNPWEKITKGWNQKDSSGKLVPPGTYVASSKYYKQNPATGSPTAYILTTIFTIVKQPNIVVTSPNGGENWKRGTTKTITWTGAAPGTNVKIELLKGTTAKTIISSTANDGSYGWTILSGQALGNDYRIRITSISNPAIKDASNNYFTISDGKITVIYPNGYENLKRGSTKTITWSSSGYAGSYVKIELLKSGVVKQTIASKTANDNSQPWTIPTWLQVGSDYKIRITSVDNPLYKDLSNNNFKIY